MAESAPHEHEMFPTLSLPTAEGMVDLRSYSQKNDLLLVFLDENPATDVLRVVEDLGMRYDDIRAENGEVVAVVHAPPGEAVRLTKELRLRFPVAGDADGTVVRRFGPKGAGEWSIYLTDRFGEIFFVWEGDGTSPPPPADEIVNRLKFIEMQCPE